MAFVAFVNALFTIGSYRSECQSHDEAAESGSYDVARGAPV